MRFIIAGILGLAVTLAMVILGLRFFDGPVGTASLRHGIEVTPLPAHRRTDIADWLREARDDLPEDADGKPVLRLPPPRPVVLEREVTGFVQLTFTVQPDGRATDVRVFGAVPPGYYEAEAEAAVRARRWDPDYDAAGRPVARQANEVIEFSVPADARSAGADG